jgi:O-antigen/teichoic acid export membrane protein
MATSISSQGFKRYFANTSWLMGHRVLSMIVALFVGVYVARYLGPARFGLFTVRTTLGMDGIYKNAEIKK